MHSAPSLASNSIQWNQAKNVTFFEPLFCFYQLVLVVWNTFRAKFKLSFISWVKQNWHFSWQSRKKLPFPHLGGLLRETGVREKSFLRSRVQLACATRLFLLDHRTTCTVSDVRHVCHDNDGRFVYADPVSQVTRLVEHIFHCLSNVWFFRQAHKRPTNLDDQFLEILTCWTQWQASFSSFWKERRLNPTKGAAVLGKSLKRKKFGKINHSGRKVTPEESSCKVWSRCDWQKWIIFSNKVLNKKTDSTVAVYSRSFVLKQFQANMPFHRQSNKHLFEWRRACLPETVSKQLREYTAVELLEAREGAEYIVLHTRVKQIVVQPPVRVGPKKIFE